LVRYWLDQGESALDLALAALTRVVELGGPPSGLGILRDKLAILATIMNAALTADHDFVFLPVSFCRPGIAGD